VTAASAQELNARGIDLPPEADASTTAAAVTAGLCTLPNVWPPRGRVTVQINTRADDPTAGKRFIPRSKQLVRLSSPAHE
jgi:hypothetical protein